MTMISPVTVTTPTTAQMIITKSVFPRPLRTKRKWFYAFTVTEYKSQQRYTNINTQLMESVLIECILWHENYVVKHI